MRRKQKSSSSSTILVFALRISLLFVCISSFCSLSRSFIPALLHRLVFSKGKQRIRVFQKSFQSSLPPYVAHTAKSIYRYILYLSLKTSPFHVTRASEYLNIKPMRMPMPDKYTFIFCINFHQLYFFAAEKEKALSCCCLSLHFLHVYIAKSIVSYILQQQQNCICLFYIRNGMKYLDDRRRNLMCIRVISIHTVYIQYDTR